MPASAVLRHAAHEIAPGLKRLEEDVARSLRYLGDDPVNWVPPTTGVDHDVVVIGGGQSGITTAFALRRAGIANVRVIDAERSGYAGTWAHRARMRTLRTPKKISGPELGIPALSFPAWFEAQHGADAFSKLVRIELADWSSYIVWYGDMTRVEVDHESVATRLVPNGQHLAIELIRRGVPQRITGRKVVLAMGMVGSGRPNIPDAIRRDIAPERYAHTDQEIDFAGLAGKRVAVLGAASSAFDAAGVALEFGASAVHLFCRGADLARAAREWPLGYPGAGNNFDALSDADRWLLGRTLRARAPGPMPDTVRRATSHANFYLHLGASVEVAQKGTGVLTLAVGKHRFDFDFLILGIGHEIDPCAQPMLASISEQIATWGDRYAPPASLVSAPGARYPYLGHGYEFQPRIPDTAPYLRNIHCFNFGAIMSFGRTVGDIASLQSGVPRLVSAISRDLFLDDRDHHLTRLTAPPPVELTGTEYRHSIRSGRVCSS